MRSVWRWTVRIFIGLVAVLVLAIGTGLLYRAWRHHVVQQALVIASPPGINESLYVPAGGIEQWVWIRGQDRNNPVVLVVHGGPGSTTTPIADRFLAFEREYTIVHWDQAGAGKTFSRAAGKLDPALSIDRIVADGIAVTEFLKKHLNTDKVIVLGWSWGSLIGIEMVRARPDLYRAYVGTGQVVNMEKGEALAYANVLAEAHRRNDERAIRDLEKIGPPPYEMQSEIVVERTLAASYEGAGNLMTGVLRSVVSAPSYSLGDASDYFKAMMASQNHFIGERMDGPLGKVDLAAKPTTYEVPIFVIDGALDNFTPGDLAREYVATITAPTKDFVLIGDAGHLALITRGDEFLRLMNERVQPLLR